MLKKVFLHVGLHKTGTTFLQQEVFPKWEGIAFVTFQPLNHLVKIMENEPLLISNEGLHGSPWYPWLPQQGCATTWSQHRKVCLNNLRELFPEGRILVSFREHPELILSLYKQFLHEGGRASFQEFFDIDHDRGLLKRDDFLFCAVLEEIQKNFNAPAFIFLHQELVDDLENLLKSIEGFIGGKAPAVGDILKRNWNKGVGHYQAKLLRQLNKLSRSYLNPDGPIPLNTELTRWLGVDPRTLCQKRLSLFSQKEMSIPLETQHKIIEHYQHDWNTIQEAVAGRKHLGLTGVGYR